MHVKAEDTDAPATRRRPAIAWMLAHPILTVALVALAVRCALIAGLNLTVGGTLFEDDSTYPILAAQRASGDVGTWGDYEHFLYSATSTFLVPLTALYRLFGPSVALGQLLAAAFATAAAAATARAALMVVRVPLAIGAGLVVALMPSQVLFSSLVFKDAAVWALLAGVALVLALSNRATSVATLVPLLAALAGLLWLLGHLRLHTLVAAATAATIAAWLSPGPIRLLRSSGVLIVCVAVPFFLGIGPLGADLVRNSTGTLEERRQANAAGAETAFVEPSRPSTPEEPRGSDEVSRRPGASTAPIPTTIPPESPEGQASTARNLRALPRGLSVMLLEPLPHQVEDNPRLRLAFLENLVWWPLLALAAVGLATCRRRLAVLAFPILCGGAVLLLYALAEGNFGTAYRHRGELVWAVAILAASGADVLRTRRQSRHQQQLR